LTATRRGRSSTITSSTEQVLASHLEHRLSGDLERDIAENYHEDVVLLSHEGVHRGHDGVRNLAAILSRYVPDRDYKVVQRLSDGHYGYLRWRAGDDGDLAHDGVDSFVVDSGLIVAQTIHYSAPADGQPGSGLASG
jgi:hypothetical protein